MLLKLTSKCHSVLFICAKKALKVSGFCPLCLKDVERPLTPKTTLKSLRLRNCCQLSTTLGWRISLISRVEGQHCIVLISQKGSFFWKGHVCTQVYPNLEAVL